MTKRQMLLLVTFGPFIYLCMHSICCSTLMFYKLATMSTNIDVFNVINYSCISNLILRYEKTEVKVKTLEGEFLLSQTIV